MHILVIGLAVFVVGHLLPMTQLKPALKTRLGDRGYGMVFGVFSLVSLALIVWGYSTAEFIGLYEPPLWGRHVTIICVFTAIVVLLSPLRPTHLAKWVGNPLAVGFLLWAVGHLFANGDVASVAMFGTFAVYCALNLLFRSKPEPAPERVAYFSGDMVVLSAAAIIFLLIFAAHPYIIGVPILP